MKVYFCRILVTFAVLLGIGVCVHAQGTDSKADTQITIKGAKFKKAKKEPDGTIEKKPETSTQKFKKAKKQEDKPGELKSD